MNTQREPVIKLRGDVARAVAAGHPWVYRDGVELDAEPGASVALVDPSGRFVGRGIAYSGAIAVRVFTLRDELVGKDLFAARITRAAELRDRIVPPETDAYRLLNGEGDRVPGFVCDVYARYAVLRTDGDGAARRRDEFADALAPTLHARGVTNLLVRSGARRSAKPDVADDASETAGPSPRAVILWGDAPPAVLAVKEHGMQLAVDLIHGQKTGLFLDQRESRHRVRQLARDLRVLNLYGYTGGFSIAAAMGGARFVETVDVAPAAIEFATKSFELNAIAAERHRETADDVMEFIARARARRERFDFVIADPPSFAPNAASLAGALRAYRALHAGCLQLLGPGGFYLAGSCSSHVDARAFAETLADAASSAGRAVQILEAWGAPADHPRLAGVPEGDYLKLVLARVH